MNDIVKTNPKVGGAVQALVPQSFDDAWRFAGALVKGGIAPKAMNQEQATAAIIAGMELGLPPSRAVNSFAVINNRASLFGDAALGIVRASGLLEKFEETQVPVDGVLTATCKVWRKGDEDPTTTTFTEQDAKKAGLWGKSGPWTQYPKRMLQMRARSFALRDAFTDLLCGFQVNDREEFPAAEMRDVTPAQTEPSISDDIATKLGLNNVIDVEVEAVTEQPGPVEAATDFDPETGEIIENDFGLFPIPKAELKGEKTPWPELTPEPEATANESLEVDPLAMQAVVDGFKARIDGADGKDTLAARMTMIKKEQSYLSLSKPAQEAVRAYGVQRYETLPDKDPNYNQGGN